MKKSFGWTGIFLKMDLAKGEVGRISSQRYTEAFIGGRALAARIYWDEISQNTDALEPGNPLILMAGPLAGTSATACSRWVMAAKSPYYYPDQYSFGNGGGFFGSAIKCAGYDGLLITGKAKSPCYMFIENDTVELRDARGLWGLTADKTIQQLQAIHSGNAQTVCIGPAGEKMVRFAVAVTGQGGTIASGMGAIMGSKNLKAIVVQGSNKVGVAYPDKLKALNRRIRGLRKGLHESIYMIEPFLVGVEKVKPAPCYGCPAGCMRATFRHTSGLVEVRKNCASATCYIPFDLSYHGRPTDISFIATSHCDRFGIDTGEFSNLMVWLQKCFQRGIVSEAETGLPLSKIGSREFLEAFVEMVVSRKGFGDLLAQGTRRASLEMGPEAANAALERITSSGYNNDGYGARVFLTTALFYATEPRNPIIQLHEVNSLLLAWVQWYMTSGAKSPFSTEDLRTIAQRVWGSEAAVDFSTYDGKARAAFMIQNRQHAKETLVACDRYFPILVTDQKDDHMGDTTLEPALFSAATGRDMSEQKYYEVGERSFNLQRAIYAREGRAGRRDDTLSEFNFNQPLEKSEGLFGIFNPGLVLPGKGDEIVVRKGKVLDRSEFETMKDEYYALRGWDVSTGLQTRKKLGELGLGTLSNELAQIGALGESLPPSSIRGLNTLEQIQHA
ncbi:MAG: hypothetical protein JW832_08225 [Deltaproteobacteria bacterium]|nr:hypothetical protein [Deltaproteobacteria bacterium]